MSDRKPAADKKLGLFFSPSGVAGNGGYLIPMGNLNVGPGEPGLGDEWHMPAEPGDAIDPEGEESVKPLPSPGAITPRRTRNHRP